MKQLILIFGVLIATAPLLLAQGIKFHEGSWEQALEKARTEDKLVFLDGFTTWCGPCKLLARKTFPDQTVGAYFNEYFVNVSLDMEKGEGLDIAQKYDIRVYPTLLFLTPEGNVVHRSAGYHTIDQFLELGERARDPNLQLASLNQRYASGDRSPEFLYDYAYARFEVQDGSHEKIAEAYLATQDNWSTEKNRELIFLMVNSTDSRLFEHLVDNRIDYEDQFGDDSVKKRIDNLIYNSMYEDDSLIAPDKAAELFEKVDPDNAGEQLARYKMTYYRQQGDREGYAEAAVEYLDKFPSDDPDELNETAWTFYRVIDDKKLLKQAVKWSKKSIDISESVSYYDTLASLYYKLEKKCKARKAAKKAIGLAMFNGMDATETEELLMKINEL